MKKYVDAVIPAGPLIALLLIPFVLSVYFFASRYNQQMLIDNKISTYDFQTMGPWQAITTRVSADLKNRTVKFFFWGVVGAIVVFGISAIITAKTAIHNHFAEEKYIHLRHEKIEWHGPFPHCLAREDRFALLTGLGLLSIFRSYIPRLPRSIAALIDGATTSELRGSAIRYKLKRICMLGWRYAAEKS